MPKTALLTSKDGFADFENLSLQNSDNYDDEKEKDLKDNDSGGFFSTLWDLNKDLQRPAVRYIL